MPKPKGRAGWPLPVLGPSIVARRLRAAFLAAAQPQTRTLILASPGTEPATLARAIHAAAPSEPPEPIVEINCSGGDPAAVERQLLGRAAGTRGSLEQVDSASALVAARRGTCVLHSVEDLSYRAQARLARALRDGEVRVAAAGHVPLACRVIAIATSSLDSSENRDRLRADLWRRLGGIRLELPPLSTRREDIPELVLALMAQTSARRRLGPRRFTRAAMALVAALPWPDNMDGLSGLVGSLAGRSGEPVRVEDVLAYLGAPSQGPLVPQTSLREARRQFEREYISAVLRQFDGRVAAAARVLGIQRTNLYRKARQLGIHGGGRIT